MNRNQFTTAIIRITLKLRVEKCIKQSWADTRARTLNELDWVRSFIWHVLDCDCMCPANSCSNKTGLFQPQARSGHIVDTTLQHPTMSEIDQLKVFSIKRFVGL